MYGKMEKNLHLANKKALFHNMNYYYTQIGQDPFDALPVTYHVKRGLEDPEFLRFKQHYDREAEWQNPNVWIVKPGEDTNRGVGISVHESYEEIAKLVGEVKESKRTFIIQKYIQNPLLINKRKFDIRSFAIITCVNGCLKGYFYEEGYLRTSSREYNNRDLSNKLIHLTNDAIQKKAEDYGKYVSGNKLTYGDFQHFLDKHHSDKNIDFERDLLPQLRQMTCDCIRAVYGLIDPLKRINTFEVSNCTDSVFVDLRP